MQSGFKSVVGIVTYHPSKQTCDRIQMLADNNISFLVYDNTPGESFWSGELRPHIIRNGENRGLGKALKNLGIAAKKAGYSHILYFDEDIIFDINSLNWIRDWYLYHKPAVEVGLIWFNYTFKGPQLPESSYAYPIKIAVSASSLINLEAAADIGWHTDRWFLEGIDYDFCFRLVQKDYKLFGVDHCPGIDPVSNQPGIRRINAKGYVYAVRIQPIRRVLNFWYALLDLTRRSIWHGPRNYVYLFLRNILTYAYDQLNAIFWTYWMKLWRR
jgi:rhamnosyltransferase